ncbi:hypothetical protein AL714_14935 [Clostridium botulinum]|uniref:hypothetical protein n=1 Tax=Clostridium botulinum TaxID=1491 RepID=UPI00099E0D08|nr:hypothetical protein [Clostridium botulinum]MCC5438659.1 hypothetical protein [Clostridium botulinum]NFR57529.1 hypothetical protein [Clostridium botulinum]OPD36140.1 hypothetical protein AL714_14935 [Clostridium botulinum]
MILNIIGKKEELEQFKNSLIIANGSYNVSIKNIIIKKYSWFNYKLTIELQGNERNINRFKKRLDKNSRKLIYSEK